MSKKKTSFCLTTTCLAILRRLAHRLGISQAAVVEQAVREFEEKKK